MKHNYQGYPQKNEQDSCDLVIPLNSTLFFAKDSEVAHSLAFVWCGLFARQVLALVWCSHVYHTSATCRSSLG